MIRFNCSHCGRRYELPAAFARMPLLCKGCGQSLVVPESSTIEPEAVPEEPEPLPPPPPPIAAKKLAETPKPIRQLPPPAPEEHEGPFLIPESETEPTAEPNVPREVRSSQTVPPPPTPIATRKPVPSPEGQPLPATTPRRRANLVPVIADTAVGLLLLAVGVFLGEILARKSTRQVWTEAGSAVEFPPVDLLMWGAPIALALLVYVLLVSKGISVGGWLSRRVA